ncbi:SAUR-like auxin-responsive protein family [Zostera marina]|uniref:SAUR-like auxin-responsive protein family n=1 Tax=Zostera marina TaxID=29655 RepID=A0A0K9PEC1_ZOSMR|nr:SAUR-like auxin-responsive protein family [Zostera marina]
MGRLLWKNYKKGSASKTPRGFVPMLVGSDAGEEKEIIFLKIKFLKHPQMILLLNMSEMEFGYDQKGIINIPCDVPHFRRILNSL